MDRKSFSYHIETLEERFWGTAISRVAPSSIFAKSVTSEKKLIYFQVSNPLIFKCSRKNVNTKNVNLQPDSRKPKLHSHFSNSKISVFNPFPRILWDSLNNILKLNKAKNMWRFIEPTRFRFFLFAAVLLLVTRFQRLSSQIALCPSQFYTFSTSFSFSTCFKSYNNIIVNYKI